MAQTESPKTRSKIMSSIRSSGTKIECRTFDLLRELNVDFEEHPKDVFGRPDFILRSKRVAIFCDGDFWHGYQVDSNPRLNFRSNREFWIKKIRQNIDRDQKVNGVLSSNGWKIVRFWEHDIVKSPKKCLMVLAAILEGT